MLQTCMTIECMINDTCTYRTPYTNAHIYTRTRMYVCTHAIALVSKIEKLMVSVVLLVGGLTSRHLYATQVTLKIAGFLSWLQVSFCFAPESNLHSWNKHTRPTIAPLPLYICAVMHACIAITYIHVHVQTNTQTQPERNVSLPARTNGTVAVKFYIRVSYNSRRVFFYFVSYIN